MSTGLLLNVHAAGSSTPARQESRKNDLSRNVKPGLGAHKHTTSAGDLQPRTSRIHKIVKNGFHSSSSTSSRDLQARAFSGSGASTSSTTRSLSSKQSLGSNTSVLSMIPMKPVPALPSSESMPNSQPPGPTPTSQGTGTSHEHKDEWKSQQARKQGEDDVPSEALPVSETSKKIEKLGVTAADFEDLSGATVAEDAAVIPAVEIRNDCLASPPPPPGGIREVEKIPLTPEGEKRTVLERAKSPGVGEAKPKQKTSKKERSRNLLKLGLSFLSPVKRSKWTSAKPKREPGKGEKTTTVVPERNKSSGAESSKAGKNESCESEKKRVVGRPDEKATLEGEDQDHI